MALRILTQSSKLLSMFLIKKNQNALLNLIVEPLKVIISSRGEECDSKVHHNISKVNKSLEGGSGHFFFM